MAEATRERVRSAIDELGFIRNESARQLRQGGPQDFSHRTEVRPTRALGFVLEELANPYFADVARGAQETLQAEGVQVIWATSDGMPCKEDSTLDFLAEQGVAGVLVTPIGLTKDRISRLREHGLAVVLVDRALSGVCSVRVDHVAGGDIAVSRLLERGPRRVSFVTGNPGLPGAGPVRERMIGAARALERAELQKPAVLVEQSMTAIGGKAAAQRLLSLEPPPAAVFCGNDLMAIGLVNELLRVGVKIPEEISVVGYDDIELASTAAVPLTTVRQPRHQLGQAAAALLLGETDKRDHQHRQIVLTPELVIRESG